MARPSPTLFSRWLAHPTELLFPQLRSHTLQSTRQGQQRLLSTRRSLTTRSYLNHQPRRKQTITPPSTSSITSSSFSSRLSRTQRRFNSSKSGQSQSQAQAQAQAPQGLSQRLRTLSREYGWAALGVYLGLSALDFPVCFVAVQLLGVDRIGHWEHVIVTSVKNAVHAVWPSEWSQSGKRQPDEDGTKGDNEESESERREKASIWTQLALAYAVHKSLIFIRVPLTAAATPKIVKVLRRWGWDIGKRKPKST
ncbi:hypothetical protein POX_a00909 [Penicillium oxalicum]|uniref:DUF1279 domain-containing protein n=1 Tax=Penicillium oxalicum (strain 114-2 / CGMCC 5302) TaxID=933388 RepID=S7ZTS1_PENO1|nr:hypothetical protein POX_a00909 [Penicillium oxalicum]EPS34110.1 hypothetical protein PDE_09072 [Penicillium oxalicum 114-2]KAI2794314.1 hypothetical protein POX_a00909 [Penicillium oxalicum]